MPRKAKAASAEAPRAMLGQAAIDELERRLGDKLDEDRRIKVETRQLRDAIAEARRGQHARRANVLGTMLMSDRSEAARALMEAYVERIEIPEDRALFGLPAREQDLIGAPASGVATGDAASDCPVPAAPDGDTVDRPEGQQVGHGAPPGPTDAEVDPGTVGEVDDGRGSSLDTDDGESGDGPTGGEEDADVAAGSPPRRNRPDGDPVRLREDGFDVPPGLSDDAPATRNAPTDRAEASIDGAVEGASAAGLRSPPQVAVDGPTGLDPDTDPFASSSPSFTPCAFVSTRDLAERIKALGFKLQKRDRGIWTVTATTPAELELLAPLGLRSHDHGRA